MTTKYRLLASALVPVMAGWFAGHPARAENLNAPFEIAQAQPLTPEEEELMKRRKRAAAEREAQKGGAEAQPRRQDDAGQPPKKPQREAAPQAGGDEQPRPPKRAQPASDPANDAPVQKPRREAAPQAGDDAQPRPPKKPAPAADPANDAQPPQKPRRDAVPQAGDDAQPRPPKKPAPAADPANDAQPPQKPRRDAVPQAGDDAQPRPPKKPVPGADPATDAQQPGQKPQRDVAPKPGDDAQPRPPKKPVPGADPATDAQQPVQKPQRDVAPQPGDDAQPRPPKKPVPGADPATDAQQPGQKPQREAAPQPGDDAQPRPPKKPVPGADPATDAQQPGQRPQRDATPQSGNDAQPRPVRPQPGTDPAAQPDARPERPRRPAPPIEDRRTERERKDEAADPSKTDDTVVLPVDKGAAVLDSDKDADNRGGQSARDERRRDRERQRQRADDLPPPRNDAEAQRRAPVVRRDEIEAGRREEGRRRDQAPDFLGALLAPLVVGSGAAAQNYEPPRRFDDRTVYETDDGIVVRSDERRRLSRAAEQSYYEDLSRGRVRETIIRPDGGRLITIYNRYGDVIQRSRMTPDGREILLVFAPEADQEQRPPVFRDPGDDLPPMRLRIPVQDYIIDTSTNPNRNYYEFLSEPPVEQVERVYTMDEVKYSARLRDKVRRIDLDTITFATGSAEVPMSQASTLRSVADAMLKVLKRDPGETFLIEGHTDAVGSDESNLVLSDQRAESVANLLTDVYGIPPENLSTQGYGERYLKVRTEGAEQQNRRVTIRRVTSLVRPATAQQ